MQAPTSLRQRGQSSGQKRGVINPPSIESSEHGEKELEVSRGAATTGVMRDVEMGERSIPKRIDFHYDMERDSSVLSLKDLMMEKLIHQSATSVFVELYTDFKKNDTLSPCKWMGAVTRIFEPISEQIALWTGDSIGINAKALPQALAKAMVKILGRDDAFWFAEAVLSMAACKDQERCDLFLNKGNEFHSAHIASALMLLRQSEEGKIVLAKKLYDMPFPLWEVLIKFLPESEYFALSELLSSPEFEENFCANVIALGARGLGIRPVLHHIADNREKLAKHQAKLAQLKSVLACCDLNILEQEEAEDVDLEIGCPSEIAEESRRILSPAVQLSRLGLTTQDQVERSEVEKETLVLKNDVIVMGTYCFFVHLIPTVIALTVILYWIAFIREPVGSFFRRRFGRG